VLKDQHDADPWMRVKAKVCGKQRGQGQRQSWRKDTDCETHCKERDERLKRREKRVLVVAGRRTVQKLAARMSR